MKKLSLILCTVLASALVLGGVLTYLSAGSATSDGATAKLERYVNEEKQYSIEYPKEWQKQELPSLDIVLFSPAKGETSQAHATMNVVSEKVGGSVTLDQFYAESVKHLTTELQEVQVENSGELNLGGLPSKWILYNHVMLNTKFRVLQYFFVAQGTVFLLTFSAPAEDFEQYRQVFDNIASSFRITSKP